MKELQLFHITCKGLIFQNNSFLLYKAKDSELFDALECPGGRVDRSEKIEDVLKREFREEIGLDLDSTLHTLELFEVNQVYELEYGWDEKTQIIDIYYKITIPNDIHLELATQEDVYSFEWIHKDTNLDSFSYKISSRKDVYKKAQRLLQ